MLRVEQQLPHHLIPSTDAHHRSPTLVRLQHGLCHSAMPEFIQVIDGTLASRQQNDVGLLHLVGTMSIKEVYTGISLQAVEIGEVAEMTQ